MQRHPVASREQSLFEQQTSVHFPRTESHWFEKQSPSTVQASPMRLPDAFAPSRQLATTDDEPSGRS